MKPVIHYFDTFSSPMGPFSLAVDGMGAVTATAFGEVEQLRLRCGPGVLRADACRTAPARLRLSEFFEGRRRTLDLPIAPAGSAFQRRVWEHLRTIAWGQTRTYGEVASALLTSARAVGRANATNPVCLIVPCHRVIGADGALTGFAFGLPIKQWLLEREHPFAA